MLQISKFAKMKYLDEILFLYRWHTTNTVTQKDRIGDYINRTRIYENNLLKNADLSTMRPEVKEFCEKGSCYKRQNFLNILIREVNMSVFERTYTYKLLGIPVYKKVKKMPQIGRAHV